EISNVALRNVQVTSNTSVSSGTTNNFTVTSISGTPTITFTGVSSGGLADGLAGLWNFDEGFGTDALDFTTNNNDGIVTGAAWNSSGYIGDALQFDGDDYVTVADSATLDMTDAVTLEAWVNVEDESNAWHLDGWSKRQLITINKSQVSGINTNMPIGLSINISGANTDASDLRVYGTDGQQLAREIEMYENDKLMAWIKVPNLTDTIDYQYYIYWGNDAVTEPTADSAYGSQAVWDSNYVGVWHMNNDPNGIAPQIKDSTSNGNDGTTYGSMTSGDLIDSYYGKGIKFDGIDDYIDVGSDTSLDIDGNSFSYLIHYNVNDYLNNPGTISKSTSPYNSGQEFVLQETSSNIIFNFFADDLKYAITQNSNYKTVGYTFNSSNKNRAIYFNGVLAISDISTYILSATDGLNLQFGRLYSRNNEVLNGTISSIYAYNNEVSSNYMSTISNNLNNPTASGTDPFYKTFDAVETKSIVSKSGAYELSANSTHTIGRINNQTIIATISSGWNHIALTYNQTESSQQMKLYVGSVLKTTADYSMAIVTNANNVIIGNNFNGTIDEVRIWNRELTQSEIATYYEQSNPSSAVSTLNPKASINGNANITSSGILTNGATATINIDSDNFTVGQNNITIYIDAGVVDYTISMNGLSALISNTGMNNVTVKQVVAFKSDGSMCLFDYNETTYAVGDFFKVSGCAMSCSEFTNLKAYTDCTGVQGVFSGMPSGC
ncbi:hypothetical protein GQ473_03995, partial [archaeon]|nr:hypothetical protein [archaeon]